MAWCDGKSPDGGNGRLKGSSYSLRISPGAAPKLEIDDNSKRGFERLGRHAEGIREADGRIIDS